MIFSIPKNNNFFGNYIIAKYNTKRLYITCNFPRQIIREIRAITSTVCQNH